MTHNAVSTATYEMPSSRKHQPKPTVLMRRPATAGPTTLAEVISALLRLTALCISSAGTISTTNERRAGLSNAMVTPPTSATAYTASTGGLPLNASAASTNDCAHRDALHDEQQTPLVGAVCDQAGPWPEQQQHGAELRGREPAECHAVVGELQHEQRLRHQRQPVADLRDQLAREEQAEVPVAQRTKRLVRRSPDRRHEATLPNYVTKLPT